MFDLVAFIPRAVGQGIPLMCGSTGETITQKSGNLNLGIPGVMYVGAISGVIGAFYYEKSIPEHNEHLSKTWETILADDKYHIIVKEEDGSYTPLPNPNIEGLLTSA